ncbi:hypothetical protein QP166_05125 [Sphingomonas sp. LR60]|uniref:hypothetical protein n=1 Tax=Sphingomonas sp. LR60 TaxID=3050233 RepID=UPI002FE42AC6
MATALACSASVSAAAKGRADKVEAKDLLYFAFDGLTTYASASGALYVNEARCHTGNERVIRAQVRDNLRGYITTEKIEAFLNRTLDNRVRRMSADPYNEPCNRTDLLEYRHMVPFLKAGR